MCVEKLFFKGNRICTVVYLYLSRVFLRFAAAAKSLQSCPILCDPIDAAHQAPPWSGLPFPSPMQESEK